jgi:hypothetical protein
MVQRAAVMALLLAGCASGKTEVDVTLNIDGSLVGQSPMSLAVDASGADTFTDSLPVMRPLKMVERLVYATHTTDGGMAHLRFSLIDASGVLGCGEGDVRLSGGKVPISIDVGPGACPLPPDAALPADLAGADFAGADLATSNADGGPSSCTTMPMPSEWKICDGFDLPSLGAIWSDASGSPTTGAVSIDTSHFHRGTASAHFHFDYVDAGTPSMARMESAAIQTPFTTAGQLYMRAFLLVPMNAPLVDNSSVIFHAYDTNANGERVGYDHNNQFLLESSFGLSKSSGTFTFGDWICVEWKFPTATGETRVWVNDVEQTALLTTGQSWSPTLVSLVLGAYDTIPQGYDWEFWIDDLVVSTARVGCAN